MRSAITTQMHHACTDAQHRVHFIKTRADTSQRCLCKFSVVHLFARAQMFLHKSHSVPTTAITVELVFQSVATYLVLLRRPQKRCVLPCSQCPGPGSARAPCAGHSSGEPGAPLLSCRSSPGPRIHPPCLRQARAHSSVLAIQLLGSGSWCISL